MPDTSELAENDSWPALEESLRKVLAASDAKTDVVDQVVSKMKPRLLSLRARSSRVEPLQIVDLIKNVLFELKLNSFMRGSSESR